MNSKKRRHRDGGTFISDADDVVSAMMMKMNEAAEVSERITQLYEATDSVSKGVWLLQEDRTLNSQKKPALKKLTLLPQVVMHLKK